ncbi:AAA domain-containing protein [Trichoderma breve]|uniref:AAA domain-containing protein n=1 Tax=Trichoderma breve TaxID=2034170 RepID=A0A9W9B997_9HYPO|nr:AAA domain-containing protein [Trichoderma breve]KAJ4855661.1 AAA domain-containing protein [Trichoderma breve]
MAKGLFDTCHREVYSDVPFLYGSQGALVNHASGVNLEKHLKGRFPRLTAAAAGTLSEVFIHCEGAQTIVDPVTHSKKNPDQVANALDFLTDMVKTTRISAADIAIITPYAANVELISRRRTRAEHEVLSAIPPAATVDSFQGQEADIMIHYSGLFRVGIYQFTPFNPYSRQNGLFTAREGVIACCERIRQCVTACSAAELQADPRLREELKTAEAKVGLQAQTELLQLVKSSLSVTKALWETFPVGPEDADTQRRFEVDRTVSISRAGKLTGAENPNGKSRLIAGRSLYGMGH